MKVLALDSATEACSAALLIDGVIAAHRFELAGRRHAELILPMLESILDQAALDLAQIDCLAFGRGPGSFTGVRIASSVAQGIAYASELRVAPISTLAALAHGVMREYKTERVAAALDARMGEIYWGLYQADETLGAKALIAESVCPPERAALPELSSEPPWYAVGSGWGVYRDTLAKIVNPAEILAERYPDAVDIALLAARVWQQNQTVSAEQALPVYLRDDVAQAQTG